MLAEGCAARQWFEIKESHVLRLCFVKDSGTDTVVGLGA
jgi:hypothetical protein